MRGKGGGLERILPDGTCEIVINRGDPFRHEGRVQPRAMVVGQMARFMEIEPTGAVAAAVARVERGGQRIDRIAKDLGLHMRLERMFAREVGLPPKTFARIVRFQGVLRGAGDRTAIALACGYYDQAHLIRDFKEFAGEAPFARQHAMPDAFTGS
jgi:transcriptional regulator GlxA family with amidase domain